jgi:hypothetical protein
LFASVDLGHASPPVLSRLYESGISR